MEHDVDGTSGDDNPAGLALEFAATASGVTAVFKPRPEHRGAPGFLHGGVAATCLDETMAAVPYALDGTHCVTATLELRYRTPVPLDGRPLQVEAWRERPGGRRHRVRGCIRLPDGTVAVEASGIFVTVPPAMAGRPRAGRS